MEERWRDTDTDDKGPRQIAFVGMSEAVISFRVLDPTVTLVGRNERSRQSGESRDWLPLCDIPSQSHLGYPELSKDKEGPVLSETQHSHLKSSADRH